MLICPLDRLATVSVGRNPREPRPFIVAWALSTLLPLAITVFQSADGTLKTECCLNLHFRMSRVIGERLVCRRISWKMSFRSSLNRVVMSSILEKALVSQPWMIPRSSLMVLIFTWRALGVMHPVWHPSPRFLARIPPSESR